MVLISEGEFDAILAYQKWGICLRGDIWSASQSFDALTWGKYFGR